MIIIAAVPIWAWFIYLNEQGVDKAKTRSLEKDYQDQAAP